MTHSPKGDWKELPKRLTNTILFLTTGIAVESFFFNKVGLKVLRNNTNSIFREIKPHHSSDLGKDLLI